jgi:hypothetical protein
LIYAVYTPFIGVNNTIIDNNNPFIGVNNPVIAVNFSPDGAPYRGRNRVFGRSLSTGF